MIINLESEAATGTLSKLLPASVGRRRAINLIEEAAGDPVEMSELANRMLRRRRATLGIWPSNLKRQPKYLRSRWGS